MTVLLLSDSTCQNRFVAVQRTLAFAFSVLFFIESLNDYVYDTIAMILHAYPFMLFSVHFHFFVNVNVSRPLNCNRANFGV